MQINTITSRKVTTLEIADAIAAASSEEFGAIFLRLSEKLLKDHEKLMAIAEVMADRNGYNRTEFLKELLQRTAYFEGKNKYEPINHSKVQEEK